MLNLRFIAVFCSASLLFLACGSSMSGSEMPLPKPVNEALAPVPASMVIAEPVDTDSDGIVDDNDACIDTAEDVDGFEDEDGCPEYDNDGDGYCDVSLEASLSKGVCSGIDACPARAEIINGVDDGDGCPDEGESLVALTDERFEILEPIHFEVSRSNITPASYSVLDQGVATMQAHPGLHIRIEGHTDSMSSRRRRTDLSEERARSVTRYLVEHGIEQSRLEHAGFGEDKPIATNETQEGRAANRRIEFVIIAALDTP